MRLSISLIFLVLCVTVTTARKPKDDDFSEFDDFDQDEFTIDTPSSTESTPLPSKTQPNRPEASKQEERSEPQLNEEKDEEVTIDEDDDDDLMFDDEEFEASDTFDSPSASKPDLEIAKVPDNLTGNRWEAYQCEALMIVLLLAYLINFLIGRTKNSRLASTLYNSQRDMLVKSFTLVGDNGQTRVAPESDEQTTVALQKESENLYVLWCSGRSFMDSLLIEFRFIKRQCLFNSLAAVIKSVNDTITYTVDYSKDDMETFVFCLAKKRCAAKLHRDMNDLSQFCSEKKNAEKRLSNGNYQILSEIGDVSSTIIDNQVVNFINKYPDALEYIHISDQYNGMKSQSGEQQQQQSSSTASTNTGSAAQQQDALNTSERAVRRVLIITFNLLAQDGRSLQVTSESITSDYLRLVIHLMDRVGAFRLASKESKNKAIKNRQRIDEQFLKNVNQQRQEQAQIRREEVRRAEKEKAMQSDDPEVQRKWEEKEHKREMKRRQPKMKQMKVKAM